MTVEEKDELAKQMRTSRRYLDLNYIKILPNTQAQMQNPAAAIANVEPKPEQLNAYQKQLLRNNDYNEKNKEKVLNKQKEYINTISKEVRANANFFIFLTICLTLSFGSMVASYHITNFLFG